MNARICLASFRRLPAFGADRRTVLTEPYLGPASAGSRHAPEARTDDPDESRKCLAIGPTRYMPEVPPSFPRSRLARPEDRQKGW